MNKIPATKLAYRTQLRCCWTCGKETEMYNWPWRLQHEVRTPPPAPIPASVQMRYSRENGSEYWANTCRHCGSIQGDHHIHNKERLFRFEKLLLQDTNNVTSNDGNVYDLYNDVQLRKNTYWLREIGCHDCPSKYIVIPTNEKLIDIQCTGKMCSECDEKYQGIIESRHRLQSRSTDQSTSRYVVRDVFCYDVFEGKHIRRKMLFIVESSEDSQFHLCSFETGEILKTSMNEWELKAYPITSFINANTSVIQTWADFDSFKQESGVLEQYNKFGFASSYPIEGTKIQEMFPDDSMIFQMDWLQYFYDYYLLSARIGWANQVALC